MHPFRFSAGFPDEPKLTRMLGTFPAGWNPCPQSPVVPTCSSIVEILAQGRAAVFLLRQAAALQLGHDQLDELADVVPGVKAAAQDKSAVGAGLVVELL